MGLYALVHLREGATENRDEVCLPSRTRQPEPHSDSQNSYASKSKNWMQGLWGSSDASNLRGRLWYVSSSLLLPFHPLIHSGKMAWMISFTFLVQATQVFLLGLSAVPSLPDWMPCHGKSSLLQGPVSYNNACNASRLASHLLPVSQHSLSVLFPPEPPYTASYPSSYRTPLPTHVCPISTLAWRQLRWLTHLRHNPRASSSLIDVHCLASLGGCYRCLSSLNMRFSYTKNRGHSSTTMTMPLPTKITSGTNDLANAPTDTSKNLNTHSTLNDGSQNARPSLKLNILLDGSALVCWSVEGWMFRFQFPQDHPCRHRRRPSLRICSHTQAERAESKFNTACSTFVRLEPCTSGKHPPWLRAI